MRIVFVLSAIFLWALEPNATIKGYTTSAGRTSRINVWPRLGRPGVPVVAVVTEGERVAIVERSANGMKIETADGTQGWVDAEFITPDSPLP